MSKKEHDDVLSHDYWGKPPSLTFAEAHQIAAVPLVATSSTTTNKHKTALIAGHQSLKDQLELITSTSMAHAAVAAATAGTTLLSMDDCNGIYDMATKLFASQQHFMIVDANDTKLDDTKKDKMARDWLIYGYELCRICITIARVGDVVGDRTAAIRYLLLGLMTARRMSSASMIVEMATQIARMKWRDGEYDATRTWLTKVRDNMDDTNDIRVDELVASWSTGDGELKMFLDTALLAPTSTTSSSSAMNWSLLASSVPTTIWPRVKATDANSFDEKKITETLTQLNGIVMTKYATTLYGRIRALATGSQDAWLTLMALDSSLALHARHELLLRLGQTPLVMKHPIWSLLAGSYQLPLFKAAMQQLPKEWTIVTMSLTHDQQSLMVVKYRTPATSTQSPLPQLLMIDGFSTMLDKWRALYARFKQNSSTADRDSKTAAWKEQRIANNDTLEQWLTDVQSCFGRSIAMLRGLPLAAKSGPLPSGPVVLVLSKELLEIPWESLPELKGQSITRMPCVSMILAHHPLNLPDLQPPLLATQPWLPMSAHIIGCVGPYGSPVTYVVDPELDDTRTTSKLSEKCEERGWTRYDKEEFEKALNVCLPHSVIGVLRLNGYDLL
jgi:hypothetical protein